MNRAGIGWFAAGLVAAMLGAGTASAGAPAQAVSPAAAPAEWVRYAESVTASVKQWLQADDEAALRLRAHLDTTRPVPGQPTVPLEIKLWIAADGVVTRIAHAGLGAAQADADLQGLLVGRQLPDRPPEKMLLPLRVRIQLEPPASASDPA